MKSKAYRSKYYTISIPYQDEAFFTSVMNILQTDAEKGIFSPTAKYFRGSITISSIINTVTTYLHDKPELVEEIFRFKGFEDEYKKQFQILLKNRREG